MTKTLSFFAAAATLLILALPAQAGERRSDGIRNAEAASITDISDRRRKRRAAMRVYTYPGPTPYGYYGPTRYDRPYRNPRPLLGIYGGWW